LDVDGTTYLFDGEYWWNKEETSLNVVNEPDV